MRHFPNCIQHPIILAAPQPCSAFFRLQRNPRLSLYHSIRSQTPQLSACHTARNAPGNTNHNTGSTFFCSSLFGKAFDPTPTFALNKVPTVVDPHPTVSTSSDASTGTWAGAAAAAEFDRVDVDPNCKDTT